jgi:hypothetical protein
LGRPAPSPATLADLVGDALSCSRPDRGCRPQADGGTGSASGSEERGEEFSGSVAKNPADTGVAPLKVADGSMILQVK